MTDTYPAFDISPVPVPTTDAVPPEQFRGLYGMPMFVSIPTSDLAESVDFWIRGLGFFDLFSVPDRLTHLRRWAFQDVLLVPGERAGSPPPVSVSFACVLSQIGQIANACEELRAGCTSGPHVKPWNSLELEIVTPENAHVIMTAARPYDPNSAEAEYLRGMGIDGPGD